MTPPRKVKSKKSQGKVRRPWAICTDCKKMKDKLAEKDALLREALIVINLHAKYNDVQPARDIAKKIRENLGE